MTVIEQLRDALDWAIAEIEGRTRYSPEIYDSEAERKAELDKAKAALAGARPATLQQLLEPSPFVIDAAHEVFASNHPDQADADPYQHVTSKILRTAIQAALDEKVM